MKKYTTFELEGYKLLQQKYPDKFVLSVACAKSVSHITSREFPSIPIQMSAHAINFTVKRNEAHNNSWVHQIDYTIINKEDVIRLYYFYKRYDFTDQFKLDDFLKNELKNERIHWSVFDESVPLKVEESFLKKGIANKGMLVLKKNSKPEFVIDAKYQYPGTKNRIISSYNVNKLLTDAEMLASQKACLLLPHDSNVKSKTKLIFEDKIYIENQPLAVKLVELVDYCSPKIIERDVFINDYYKKFMP